MVGIAYFKDSHQEEILAYSINETRCGDCSIIFYTPSGKYMYQTCVSDVECRCCDEGYLKHRVHVFSKYDPNIDNWLRCDIEKIVISSP